MADAFYPFVGTGPAGADEETDKEPGAAGKPEMRTLGDVVQNPARIAVFDDPAAAPRVVVVQPKDVRSYLEEVTATVTRLAKEQGGKISFTVIREVVENLVHAYFSEPTISILDGGNTIRFSDQGPGIAEKDRALEYGTTSATEEMKRYIRGVGSGLPYAQQYMEDHGGTLTIEDNISSGTIVTISMPSEQGNWSRASMHATPSNAPMPAAGQTMAPQQPAFAPATAPQAAAMAAYPTMPAQAARPQMAATWAAYPQAAYPQQAYPGYPQPSYQAAPAMPQTAQGQGWQMACATPAGPAASAGAAHAQAGEPLTLGTRAMQVLEWLSEHETVGPTDLAPAYGGSLSTWTRQLKELEDRGILRKQGQKRRLTELGRTLL